jgi:hypothetical protein
MVRVGHCRSGRLIGWNGRYLTEGSFSMVMTVSRSAFCDFGFGSVPLGATRAAKTTRQLTPKGG